MYRYPPICILLYDRDITFILKGTVLQWAEIIYDEEWQTKQTAESLLMTNIGDNGLPRRIAVH